MAAAYLAGLAALLDLIEREQALLLAGAYEQFIAEVLTDANLDIAFAEYRAALIDSIRDSMRYSARAIPGMTASQVAAIPNILDPATIEAIRQLDDAAMSRIADEVRATVRAAFQQGGTPKEALALLKQSVGLGPSQVGDVATFREGLLVAEKPLTAAQIERAVVQYSERRIAGNAATVARTSALVAHKTANDLAWAYAEEQGLVPSGMTMFKRWSQIPRPTRRPEHWQMDGERVPFSIAYSNGQMVPGIGPGDTIDFNCGCVSEITLA